jgi:hypothetical protein
LAGEGEYNITQGIKNKKNKITRNKMKYTYPMGTPYCGYANMGMPARITKELEFFSLKKIKASRKNKR